MSQMNLDEKLSLLMDDEAGPSDTLSIMRQIERNPDAQEQWRRYCLVREALRSGQVLVPDRDFVSRISAAVAEEPTVLAPRSLRRAVPEKVVSAALAASLALVGVLVGKSLQEYSPIRGADLLALSDLMGPSVQAPADPEFRDYLVSHYGTAYLSGAQGMLPSVRLVSADAGR